MVTADASSTTTYSITVNTSEKGHTLTAYKIFSATSVGTNNELAGLDWSSEIKTSDSDFLNDINTALSTSFSTVPTADAVAEKLTNDNVEAFATAIAKHLSSGAGTTLSMNDGSTAYTKDGFGLGYYLVLDSSASANVTSVSAKIVQVVNESGASIDAKMEYPTFDKTIGEINDTTAAAGTYTYQEVADHDIGDNVPFKLTATLPSNLDDYDVYKLVFHDDLQKDVFKLCDTSAIKVTYYADSNDKTGVDITKQVTAATSTAKDSKFENGKADGTEDFTVTIGDVTKINITSGDGDPTYPTAGGIIVVDYTAELTSKANIGATGNWNGAYLEYSNNPNVSGDGTNTTNETDKSPVDYTVAFTYQTVVDKVDGDNKPLANAAFTLYKVVPDTSEGAEEGATTEVELNITPTTTYGSTTFIFNGLDAGDYVLKETTTPSGYNKAEPISFTIKSTLNQTDGSEALSNLTVDSTSTFNVVNLVTAATKDEDAAVVSDTVKYAGVRTTVENKKGLTLPSTGGIGTTVFYLSGGVLVVGAGVTLIDKKRMKANK
jgi:LPXTG-motif cell wall-anchored protein